ncbi:hypothetical protein [Pantoea ananatis]|uniref:hypothetical protein n=1 Tax=Pantoea ananas TaxID=553 RepID=UPI0002322F29|nr:hypothetical protein [Pantoea ananatis]AER31636.1 hypothetical protein PAGR_g1109 [Pantoea ananatis PA13]
MNAIFILDERWLINALSVIPNSIGHLENIADLVENINEKSNSFILCCSEIYEKQCSDQQLCDVIFGDLARNPISRDALLRLSVMLNSMEMIDITSDNKNIESDALKILKEYDFGGLIFNEDIVTDWWKPESMMVVNEKNNIEKYYRLQSLHEMIPYPELSIHLDDLFPLLYFLPDAKDFSKLGVSHREHLKTIIEHLSYLNDHARNHYLEDRDSFNRTASSHGVDLSGESSNTRSNPSAIRERIRTIEDMNLGFEMHTKITWNKGRIHFHIGNNLPASVSEITEGKLIIGIVCEHLST